MQVEVFSVCELISMVLCSTTCKLPRNPMSLRHCRQVHVLMCLHKLVVCRQLFLTVHLLTSGTSMWERLTAPEDSFSKLQRENLAIIESYGTALMEVVCRDACDGHEIGRVRLSKSTSFHGRFSSLHHSHVWFVGRCWLWLCWTGFWL